MWLFAQTATRSEALIVSDELKRASPIATRAGAVELQRKAVIAARNGSHPLVGPPPAAAMLSTLSSSVPLMQLTT
jgi:hypothetical protein